MAVQFLDRSVRLPRSAGQIVSRLTGGHDEWQMTDAERAALSDLSRTLNPHCAIEIGVYRAGSLAVLAAHSQKVYALDIDPACEASYSSRFPNAQFITGRSKETLPALIERLQTSGEAIDLILIDADHSEQGVRTDIENVLRYRPSRPLYIVMHDSFNPDCRRGMKNAAWAANDYVHMVELDFVGGRLVGPEEPTHYREMWCGLGLAIMLPEKRSGALTIHQNEALLFEAALRQSIHRFPRWRNSVLSVTKIVRGLHRRVFALRRHLTQLVRR